MEIGKTSYHSRVIAPEELKADYYLERPCAILCMQLGHTFLHNLSVTGVVLTNVYEDVKQTAQLFEANIDEASNIRFSSTVPGTVVKKVRRTS